MCPKILFYALTFSGFKVAYFSTLQFSRLVQQMYILGDSKALRSISILALDSIALILPQILLP